MRSRHHPEATQEVLQLVAEHNGGDSEVDATLGDGAFGVDEDFDQANDVSSASSQPGRGEFLILGDAAPLVPDGVGYLSVFGSLYIQPGRLRWIVPDVAG
jgi:hypothetical protein